MMILNFFIKCATFFFLRLLRKLEDIFKKTNSNVLQEKVYKSVRVWMKKTENCEIS